MEVCEDPRLIGFPTAMGPISEFETKVIPKLLNNAESWLGINESHIKTLQDFQDNFLRKVFQVAAKGTPKGMLRLDSQILPMRWKIVHIKLRAIVKTMGKPEDNLCRKALLEGQKTCNGEDLLSECVQMCRRLNVRCVTEGTHNALEKCNLKKAIWRENNEEIRQALASSEKVRNTRIPETEKERNYLKRMNLPDARTWFRYTGAK